jgi:transposase
MKKSYLLIIGIDVSKLKLDVWIMKNPEDAKQHHFIVSNNEIGIKRILTFISKQKINSNDCLFCFENTGVYSMPLAFVLAKKGIDHWVVPALEIKRSKGISRGKNDKNDSKDIAYYAHTHLHKLKLNKIPEKELLQLKLLFSEREKLVKVIKIMDRTRENEGFFPKEIIKETIKLNTKTVTYLRTQLLALEHKIGSIIKDNERINSQIKLIKSVPGVGSQTALYLILTTKCFDAFENWRKLACYSGIAPFEYQSGSSIRGRTKVNHLADKKMKSMMQMCVLTAIKHDAEIKMYFLKKKEEGKNSMLIMNNIRCKIMARVFAVVNRGTPFINTKKFAA